MGNSVSCFDPVREHPPYSWPKDHPGREAAIAEKKRQRRQQKIAGLKGNITEVSKESAKDVLISKTGADQSKELVTAEVGDKQSQQEPTTEGKGEEGSPEEQIWGTKQREESRSRTEIEEQNKSSCQQKSPAELSPEGTDNRFDVDLHSGEEGVSISGPGALSGPASPAKSNDSTSERPELPVSIHGSSVPAKLSKILVQEEMLVDADAVPINSLSDENGIDTGKSGPDRDRSNEGSQEGHQPKADERAPSGKALEDLAIAVTEHLVDNVPSMDLEIPVTKHTGGKIPVQEEAVHSMAPFENRLAQFEYRENELPEPKELTREVFDPVTGEFSSIAEYRGRQMARAEGLVKERVEQYEDVVDERAKELAKQAAIEAMRTGVMENHQWRFKSEKEAAVQPSPAENVSSESLEGISRE